MNELAKSKDIEMTKFCNETVSKQIFKSSQSARNAITKAEKKNEDEGVLILPIPNNIVKLDADENLAKQFSMAARERITKKYTLRHQEENLKIHMATVIDQ